MSQTHTPQGRVYWSRTASLPRGRVRARALPAQSFLGGGREERAVRRATTVEGGLRPPPSSHRRFFLQTRQELPRLLIERRTVRGGDGFAGNESLVQRINALATLDDFVVQMGPGAEPRGARVPDHLTLVHPGPDADAGGDPGEMRVAGLVAR